MNERCVWIDLDNAPHVLFFAPLIRGLEQRGTRVHVTVRSFGQTEELADAHGLKFTVIGEHRTPRHFAVRAAATIWRATQLAQYAAGIRPDAAVGHGARALTLATRLLGIPSMTLYDYEFASTGLLNRLSQKVLIPECIPDERLNGSDRGKFVRYPGFKEDVYVHDFVPDPKVLASLNLDRKRMIVTLRPPATWAHYHDQRSEILFGALISRLRRETNAQVLVLTRNARQRDELMLRYEMAEPPFLMLKNAVDALSLMWYSDAVFSGGGTMVREAALMGIPVYSIFGGKLGSADAALARQGRLVMLHDPEDVLKLEIRKRDPTRYLGPRRSATRDFILQQILAFTNGVRR